MLGEITDDRTEEIFHLEQLTSGMNGNTPTSDDDTLLPSGALTPDGRRSLDGRRTPERRSLDERDAADLSNLLSTSPGTNGDLFDGPTQSSSGIGSNSLSRITTGKSGRVIEKLMAENDRLKRDLKTQTTAREEERKEKEAIRSSRDSLQSTNENLIHQTNVDKASLARKDRKIEELKAEKDRETARRQEADSSLNELVRQSDVKVQELKTTLSQETAERKKAVNQYEVLQQSWKHLDEGYRTRVDRLRAELETLQAERERDHQLLKRLEVTIEQQRQEVEKLRVAKNRITDKYEKTMTEAEREIADIRVKAEATAKDTDETLDDAKETLGRLRHVMAVQRDLREA